MDPDISNLLGKRKLVRIIEEFKKSGVKLQCLTGEGKSVLVRIIGSFEKPRVREIGILLYFGFRILRNLRTLKILWFGFTTLHAKLLNCMGSVSSTS